MSGLAGAPVATKLSDKNVKATKMTKRVVELIDEIPSVVKMTIGTIDSTKSKAVHGVTIRHEEENGRILLKVRDANGVQYINVSTYEVMHTELAITRVLGNAHIAIKFDRPRK
jgi:hypothetical protein